MTGLVILAAGPSSRLGQPKQRLVYKGKTLLEYTVEAALNSECEHVIVILGAYAEKIQSDIENANFISCYNSEWEEGMASSIRLGIATLQETRPDMSDVIIAVSDQPFVNFELLNQLIDKKAETGKGIIACSYNNTFGVPVLFDKKFFPELLSLQGQEGAKKLLIKHSKSVAAISFPLGENDIDTIEDYEALISEKK